MPSKLLKTQNPECGLPATIPGLKPGDFALGSVESRAAARALIHGLDRPQPGDIFLDLRFLGPKRAMEVWRAVLSTRNPGKTFDRIPGEPRMWVRLPFDQDSVKNLPPLNFEDVPEDVLKDIESFRKAKDAGAT